MIKILAISGSPRPQGPGDAAIDAEGLKTITDLADNMAWLLKNWYRGFWGKGGSGIFLSHFSHQEQRIIFL